MIEDKRILWLVASGVTELTVLMDGDAAGIEAAKKVAGEAAERFPVRRISLPHGLQPDQAIAQASQSGERPDWLVRLPRFPAE